MDMLGTRPAWRDRQLDHYVISRQMSIGIKLFKAARNMANNVQREAGTAGG